MGKIMYAYQAREILDVPDVRVACSSHRRSVDFPMVDVRYNGDSIGYIGRDFMDERPHREWTHLCGRDMTPGREVPPGVPFQDVVMWMRPSWKAQMPQIEARLPRRTCRQMRKKALKMGFKWWRN